MTIDIFWKILEMWSQALVIADVTYKNIYDLKSSKFPSLIIVEKSLASGLLLVVGGGGGGGAGGSPSMENCTSPKYVLWILMICN